MSKSLLEFWLVSGFCLFSCCAALAQEKQGAHPAWTKGSETARVIIEVFNDYQCPSCAAYQNVLKKVQNEHSDKALFIYRNFPLKMHLNAVAAAQAVEAAGEQGKFWQMLEMIYRNQKNWQDTKYRNAVFSAYALKLRLRIKRFKKDSKSLKIAARIQSDIERGKSLNIAATPTVLVNGELLSPDEMQKLSELIEEKSKQN